MAAPATESGGAIGAGDRPSAGRGEVFSGGRPWLIARLVVGAILVAASLLKISSPFAGWPGGGILAERRVILAVAVFEALLGLGMISGRFPKLMRGLSIFTFSVLSLAALYLAVIGARSCGCFGSVHLSPWYTAGFDVLAVGVLTACRPAATSRSAALGRRMWGIVAVILIGLAIFARMAVYPTSGPADGGGLLPTAGGVTVLEPERWVGHSFPLAPYTNAGRKLTSGDWVALLYRADCSHCREAIARYKKRFARAPESGPRLALLEIPPYGADERVGAVSNGVGLSDRLSNSREWFADAPVAVFIRDGFVLRAVEGVAAESPESVLPVAGAKYSAARH